MNTQIYKDKLNQLYIGHPNLRLRGGTQLFSGDINLDKYVYENYNQFQIDQCYHLKFVERFSLYHLLYSIK